jgi:chromosome condensin MukBEF complex kleisin-like MukF subunit
MQYIADSTNSPSRDLTDRIARPWAADVSLQLDRERLAFLSGIHASLELNSDPLLGEAELRDVFALRIVASHLRSVDAGLQDLASRTPTHGSAPFRAPPDPC